VRPQRSPEAHEPLLRDDSDLPEHHTALTTEVGLNWRRELVAPVRGRVAPLERQLDLPARLREDIQKVTRNYRRDLVLYRDEVLPERR